MAQLQATFQADFSSFQDASAKAEVSLKAIETGADKTGVAIDKMTKSLDGTKIKQQADVAIASVENIGGTATLTDKELQKIGRTADEAIAKYKKLGEEVPPQLQGISDAAKKAEGNTGLIGIIADAVGPKLLAAFSVGAITAWVGSTLDAASHVADLASKLDVSNEAIQRWGYAASLSGSSIDDVSTALAFMNKTLGGGNESTVAALKAAGLQFDEIRKLSPEDAFNAITEAIQKIPDPMTQARVTTELLGKSAADLLPAIRDGFKDVGAEATIMSDEVIAANDKIGDSWTALKGKAAVFSAGLLTLLAQGIEQYNGVTRESIAKTEKEFGESLTRTADGAIAHHAAVLKGQLVPALGDADKALAAYDASVRDSEPKLKASIATQEDYNKKIKALADTLTGQAVVQKANDLAAAIKLAGGASHLTADQTEEFFKAADALVKGPLGSSALPKNLKDFWETNGKLALTLDNEVNPSLDGFYDHLYGIDKKLPEVQGAIKTFLADTRTNVLQAWKDDEKAGKDSAAAIERAHKEALKAIEDRHNQFVQTMTGYGVTLIDGLTHGWDGFKQAAISVADDIVHYFEKVFVTKMLEYFGLVQSNGLSMFAKIGEQSVTTTQQMIANQQEVAAGSGAAAIAGTASYAAMFGSMISGMATVYLAWKFLQAAIAPHITPRTPTPTSPPPNTSPNPEPGSPDYGSSLDYAEQLAQQGLAAGGGQEAMQALTDYLYQHPELRGHSPSGSFRGGTGGQYLDFGAGTAVMLHGRERVMTQAEGWQQAGASAGVTVVVQTIDGADTERWLRQGGARQIADALGPHLARVLA